MDTAEESKQVEQPQVKVVDPVAPDSLKALLAQIEATYRLLQEGMFTGESSKRLIQVMAWLETYHKLVLAQLPKEPVKKEAPVVLSHE